VNSKAYMYPVKLMSTIKEQFMFTTNQDFINKRTQLYTYIHYRVPSPIQFENFNIIFIIMCPYFCQANCKQHYYFVSNYEKVKSRRNLNPRAYDSNAFAMTNEPRHPYKNFVQHKLRFVHHLCIQPLHIWSTTRRGACAVWKEVSLAKMFCWSGLFWLSTMISYAKIVRTLFSF
jgi:hypothetical protein